MPAIVALCQGALVQLLTTKALCRILFIARAVAGLPSSVEYIVCSLCCVILVDSRVNPRPFPSDLEEYRRAVGKLFIFLLFS